MHSLDAVERFAARFKGFLERRPGWALCGVALGYLVCTSVLASRKLLWNDELYTYYIASLPHTDIRRALATGAEQIPPAFHMLTRGVLQVWGPGPISIRAPEMLGFLVMLLCLYLFVARRTTPFYGLLAMVLPLASGAYRYAYEARPYGLVLGLAGIALVSWQSASEGEHRGLSLGLLSSSLAAAIASHYYAILIIVALGVGELIRSKSRRRLDAPVWVAFGLGTLVPLLVFAPLILQAATYSDTFWSRLSFSQLPASYHVIIGPAAAPVAVALLVATAYASWRPVQPHTGGRRAVPPHEVGVALALALIPVLTFGVAVFMTNAYASRYAAPAILGFGLLAPYAVHALPRGRALIGTVLLSLLSGSFALTQYRTFLALGEHSRNRSESFALLQAKADMDLPIVASDPQVFMELIHYAPPAIAQRLVYLADPEKSLRRLGHNSVDRGMRDLVGPWLGLPVREYQPYIESHPRFWVYGELGWLSWLTEQLQDDDRHVQLRSRLGEEYLLLVTRRSGPES